MLRQLQLINVGPAPRMTLDLGARLNLLTGDNGLGKSFLLDIAWWALTGRWPAEVNRALPIGLMAKPYREGYDTISASGLKVDARIEFSLAGEPKEMYRYASSFVRGVQAWTAMGGRPFSPGLVLYAQVDGSFALWDSARNYWRTVGDEDVQDRPPAYVFSPREVWNGLRDEERGPLCNGLILDWAGWQKEKGAAFKSLRSALAAMSPSDDEKIEPGELTRISLDDPRDIPTLKMPYGQSVAVLHASAGIRRIISLAYLLVWGWEEHQKASSLLGQQPASQIIFLIDEIESHLHPRWQRRIISSLLNVMKTLTKKPSTQLIAATHSPLVMASTEPLFDPKTDAWFDLDIDRVKNQVELTKRNFVRRGDVCNWLMSEAFDLGSARSIEAEGVLNEASKALTDENFGAKEARKLDAKLRKVLGDTDPFWMRWRFVAAKRGWLS